MVRGEGGVSAFFSFGNHSAELEDAERAVSVSHTFLGEENGAAVVTFDGDCNCGIDGDEEHYGNG